jgi:hypothetical protein
MISPLPPALQMRLTGGADRDIADNQMCDIDALMP